MSSGISLISSSFNGTKKSQVPCTMHIQRRAIIMSNTVNRVELFDVAAKIWKSLLAISLSKLEENHHDIESKSAGLHSNYGCLSKSLWRRCTLFQAWQTSRFIWTFKCAS